MVIMKHEPSFTVQFLPATRDSRIRSTNVSVVNKLRLVIIVVKCEMLFHFYVSFLTSNWLRFYIAHWVPKTDNLAGHVQIAVNPTCQLSGTHYVAG